MKRITLFLLLLPTVFYLHAQNLAGNPGFEDDAATFTVIESDFNVLRRVAQIWNAETHHQNPTSDVENVTAGMWVKKAPNTGFIKLRLSTAEKQSGTTGLHMFINSGWNSTANMTWWANCVAMQKLPNALDNSKTYVISVWAKKDPTANNQCNKLTFFLTDNTHRQTNFSRTVDLIDDGTVWTKYEAVFDLAAHTAANPTADFSVAFAGVGIATTQAGGTTGITDYSGLYIDNFSVTEIVLSGTVLLPDFKLAVSGKSIKSSEAGTFDIYSLQGAKVYQLKNADVAETALPAGLYILQFTHNNGTQITRKITIK